MDILGKKSIPDVELSDEDLNALGTLNRTNVKGLQFNPYTKINPKYLELSKFEDEEDDDWLYTTEEQKPRGRAEKLFINTGSATLVGGGFGLLGAFRILRSRNFLNLASFKHPVKRSEILTSMVDKVRQRSGQFGSFGFWTGGSAAVLDMNSVKAYNIPYSNQTLGDMHLSVAGAAAVGGFTYGLTGSKFRSVDLLRTKPKLLKQFPDGSPIPKFYELNQRMEYNILKMCRNKEVIPRWMNWTSATGRCALLAATAYTLTWSMDKLSTAKWMRDVKRWKW